MHVEKVNKVIGENSHGDKTVNQSALTTMAVSVIYISPELRPVTDEVLGNMEARLGKLRMRLYRKKSRPGVP